MTASELENTARTLIREELDQLPAEISRAAARVVIRVAPLPDPDETGAEEDWLGVFEGYSLAEGEPNHPDSIPRITLFLQNLWDYSGHDPEVFAEEVRITFRHELGHYLGWSEDEVEQRGL